MKFESKFDLGQEVKIRYIASAEGKRYRVCVVAFPVKGEVQYKLMDVTNPFNTESVSERYIEVP